MTVAQTARAMTWQQWARGAFYSAIHGAGQGLMAVAVGVSWKQTLALIGSSLLVGLGIYLKSNPLPGEKPEDADHDPR